MFLAELVLEPFGGVSCTRVCRVGGEEGVKPPNGLSNHPRVPLDGLSHHPRIFHAAVQVPDRDHTARMSVNKRIKPKIDVNLLGGNEDEAELDGDRCEKQLADTSGCGCKVRVAPHQPFDPFKPPFFIVFDQNRSPRNSGM